MPSNLETLFGYLDSLDERPPLDELAGRLRRLELTRADVAGWVHFSEQGYQRNLVRAGPWYHLWVLCWKNGQRSPIHDHARSACGVRVLDGVATITRFEFAPNGHIKATGSEDLPAGTVVCNCDDDLHQVSNLQAGQAELITLHLYLVIRLGVSSPPWSKEEAGGDRPEPESTARPGLTRPGPRGGIAR